MERNEKFKLSVDVALYYFTIITVLGFLSRVLSYLLFRNNWELASSLKANIPWYVISIAVIICLTVLSYVLKKKLEDNITVDRKSLLYIIVGVLLIINAVINIPTQVALICTFSRNISHLSNSISQIQKNRLVNSVYWATVPVVIYLLQIGIGIYFISSSKNQDKHIKEIYKY